MKLIALIQITLGAVLVYGLPIAWGASTLIALWHLLRRRSQLARFWGVTAIGMIALAVVGALGIVVIGNVFVGCSLHGGCPTPRTASYYVFQSLAYVYLFGVFAWAIRRMLIAKRLASPAAGVAPLTAVRPTQRGDA